MKPKKNMTAKANVAPDFLPYISEEPNQSKEIWVMKTFIVYSLDTGLPIAVGEAIKAEWARIETADKTKIRAENLIAEEIAIQIVRPSQSTAET
jgi:hypothetical protein